LFILKFKHYGRKEKDMVEVELDVKQWGNNLGVRLPAAIARESHLTAHQRVRIRVLDGEIIIKPILETPLTLEQRLAMFTPTIHSGEVMATSQPLGAETW
jgi:antitoxin MazE